MAPSYTAELRIAELSVKRACVLAEKVYHSHVKGTITKADKSPVTSIYATPFPFPSQYQ